MNFLFALTLITIGLSACAQPKSTTVSNNPVTSSQEILPAAHRVQEYMPLLKGKRVAVFANQTSTVGDRHLVDVLQENGIVIKVIFGPEHGFRGTADAGEKVESTKDQKTGAPVVSLYGAKKKPSKEDLKDVDLMLFDIQDVGVRFYTYISSLQDYMEAAIEHNIPLMVLDRPNPNGHYVDGPVLESQFKSFIGMQPVPIVYGMTIGEYAQMILQEGWLSAAAMDAYTRNVLAATYPPGASYFGLTVIPNGNYTHKSKYHLPVKPSPNLPDMGAIYWYPSTCLFEGTVLSEGRGTDKPFQVFGHPALPKTLYAFTPNPTAGAKSSKHYGVVCYGWDVSGPLAEVEKKVGDRIQLSYLIKAYELFPKKDSFFILPKSGKDAESFFAKLAGNTDLMAQIRRGVTEDEIRRSWQPKLDSFKMVRKKYLLYPDFE
ncbi:MAG TPA: DUF1343 domain-containing protein [Flavisolibacter sp.]